MKAGLSLTWSQTPKTGFLVTWLIILHSITVKVLKVWTPEKFIVITLKFEHTIKDADRMANSVDPDQTRSSLIWVCTVCQDLSVGKLTIIMVCRATRTIRLHGPSGCMDQAAWTIRLHGPSGCMDHQAAWTIRLHGSSGCMDHQAARTIRLHGPSGSPESLLFANAIRHTFVMSWFISGSV